MIIFTAVLLSSAASQIRLPGFQGEVHSVFRRVLNITAGEQLITLIDARLGDLPNCLLVELPEGQGFDRLGIKIGMPVFGDGRQLMIPDAGLAVKLDRATLKPSHKQLKGKLLSWPDREKRLARAYRIGSDLAQEVGLAPLWLRIENILGSPIERGWEATALVRLALKPIEDLMIGIKSADLQRIERGAGGLSGLGIGLTPSGDDLLTGLVGSLVLLAEASDQLDRFTPLINRIVESARGRTNLIAFNYLKQASCGEISTKLADYISSILVDSPNTVEQALPALFSFGATSGSELALGATIGLSLDI